MRLILLVLFALFIYWMVKNIIIPVIRSYFAIRKQQKEFYRKQQQRQQRHNRPEGHVEIKQDRGKSRGRIKNEEGDYIDYEEVK